MATTQRSVTNLVSTSTIPLMRQNIIHCTLTDCRPSTRLYVFFDSVNVQALCTPTGSPYSGVTGGAAPPVLPMGSIIYTDASGGAQFDLHIDGGKYTNGVKEILVTDVEDLELLKLNGNTYGSAKATFNSNGIIEVYQKTTTIATDVFVTITQPIDPLAQSFFTYGVKGGVFVTAIELFFHQKDPVIPIQVEMRNMLNGYPMPLNKSNPDLVVSLPPGRIKTSNNASVGTVFRFNTPIYIPEDTEACFVVIANTNKYNIFTSYLGEKQFETGNTIYDQPYVGDMFKQQNNSTWSAAQYEDIKFKMYMANFNTQITSDLNLSTSAPSIAYSGDRLFTSNGSQKVILKGTQQHALSVGSKIGIQVDDRGVYNGILGAAFNNQFTVTRVIDEYTVEFDVQVNAATTGNITSGGIVTAIKVTNSGSGYTNTPTVTISAPASGTTATAIVETLAAVDSSTMEGGVYIITVTNPGSGYTSTPSVIIGGVGVGAAAVANIMPVFTVSHNTAVTMLSPSFRHSLLQDTSIDSTVRLTNVNYGFTPEYDMPLHSLTAFDTRNMVASRQNAYDKMSNANSIEVNVALGSSNSNVSPMIDARSGLNIYAYNNQINDQSGIEDTSATIQSSGVISYTGLQGGTGYSSAPAVTIIPAENDKSTNIVAATATATVSGGQVTALSITPGSGYTKTPTIVIAPPTSGTPATAQAVIAPLNSEIGSNGSAFSRYITKKVQLKSPSTAIKLLSYTYSTPETNVDWYVRTSLAGDASTHEDNKWVLMKCDVNRDKQTKRGQYFDYEFALTNIQPFDVYDLKCVMSSTNPAVSPYIKKYRVIVAA